MENKKEMTEVFTKLKSMSVEERKIYLKKVNLTKKQVCEHLESDKVNIPMKSMALKTLSKMEDEQFIDFVATKIDLLSSGLFSKFI